MFLPLLVPDLTCCNFLQQLLFFKGLGIISVPHAFSVTPSMADMAFDFSGGDERMDLFGGDAGQPESQLEAASECGEATEAPAKRRRLEGKPKTEEKICCICEEQSAVPKFTKMCSPA